MDQKVSATFEPLEHPGHLVRRLHQISVSVFLESTSAYDVTHLQFASLQAINAFPGIDQAKLGRLVATDRQTTSVVVKKLLERGLVDRKEKNKRTYALFVTGPARALLKVIEEHVPEIDNKILQALSDEEREDFMRLLRKVVSSGNELSRAPFEQP